MLIITPLGVYLWTIIICRNGLTVIWHRGSTRKTLFFPRGIKHQQRLPNGRGLHPWGCSDPDKQGPGSPALIRSCTTRLPSSPSSPEAWIWLMPGTYKDKQSSQAPCLGMGMAILFSHSMKARVTKTHPFSFRATESSYYNLSLHYMLRKESYFFHITNYLSKSKMDVAVLGTQDIMTIKRTCQCAPWVCKLKATISLLVCFSTLLHSNPVRPK